MAGRHLATHPMDLNETLHRYSSGGREQPASAALLPLTTIEGAGIKLTPKKSSPYYVINYYLSPLSRLGSSSTARPPVRWLAPSMGPGFY